MTMTTIKMAAAMEETTARSYDVAMTAVDAYTSRAYSLNKTATIYLIVYVCNVFFVLILVLLFFPS